MDRASPRIKSWKVIGIDGVLIWPSRSLNIEKGMMKMTSHAEGGLKVTPVSMGKGRVAWRIDFPPVCRKDERLKGQWDSLEEALRVLKECSPRSGVESETAALADERCPEISWSGTA